VNIAQILSDQASERGESPALIDTRHGQDRVLSFHGLESASARFAERLHRKGIGPGDEVLILHPMTAELYAFLIAIFRVGAVGMFLDPSAGRGYVERCLRISPPKAFFGSAKAQLLRLWIRGLRRVALSICTSPVPGAMQVSLHAPRPELKTTTTPDETSPALSTFTIGSTGEPKAALRTHGFLLAQHRALHASLQLRVGTFDLTTLPVFVLANLASGVTSVIPDADMRRPGHIDPRPVIRQLQRLPITTMAASPALVARLTAECRTSQKRIERIERVFMGGAPVFPEDLREAHDVFPKAEITAVYGSTETEPMAEVALSSISKDDFDAMEQGRGLLAGEPVASIALRIIRNCWGEAIPPLDEAQFQARCLGAEKVGEIVVCGEHVLQGYLHGAGDAETKFRIGGKIWHRTGDLGWFDLRGRLWLMGRASALIEDERGVVYPFAVECAARQIEGVRRAAILSVGGRRILALEADSDRAVDAARGKLKWAELDEVRLLRSIPMDKRHNAKVDYVALRRMLSKAR
jgi:acyl-CoA synthetase (AMP-forming)/AMP-acid ligase II